MQCHSAAAQDWNMYLKIGCAGTGRAIKISVLGDLIRPKI
eukprot:COSAG01_NODE_335_length_18690_cov_7.693185_14_plen_40_part_00